MSEPAAWFYQYPGETGIFMCADAKAMEGLEEKGYILTPLYTHPVKELTEWEIKECWEEATEMQEHFCSQYFDFAQLILKKAQEK